MAFLPPAPPDRATFDAAWYRAQHPDLDPGTDPATHYHLIGWMQFRDPAPWFSTAAYLKAHPDVARAALDPFDHWLRHGRIEGRAVFPAGTPPDSVGPSPAVAADLSGVAALVDSMATAAPAAHLDAIARFLLQLLDSVATAEAGRARDAAEARARLARVLDGWDVPGALHAIGLDVLHRFPPVTLPVVEQPDVTVVVPAFGQFAATHACLQSLAAHPGRHSFEVVLVDDGSTDETVFAPFVLDGVRVLRAGGNTGFVDAVNAGAALARGRFLLLLNNDTVAGDGWLDALVDTLEADAGTGVAGSRLLGADGAVQDCGGVVFQDASAANLGRGQSPDQPELRHMRPVDYVSGAALLLRTELFRRLGGLDAAYAPGYYEDVDLCFRVREAGLRVVVQPASTLTHIEGTTSGRSEAAGMKRFQARNRTVFQARWAAALASHAMPGDMAAALARLDGRTALFVDETTPTPDRDAGSCAAVSHMEALQRLGYTVQFAPSHGMVAHAGYTEALERRGVLCHRVPHAASVEAVLRRLGASCSLAYLHRMQSAVQYTALVRRNCPQARVVYGVADLHHLRVAREAALSGDAALALRAERLRGEELAAVRAADSVVVHSSAEAALLAQEAPGVPCTTVPWAVPVRPVVAPWAGRQGVAFIGSFGHPPNGDAAEWLATVIMPLVWARAPDLPLLLVGGGVTDRVRALEGPRVRVLGHVPDLHAALGQVRLTTAPLRYGAGLKGKVLASLAAGLPCVMSEVAAEGMDLPPDLHLVCRTAADHAAAILALHADEARAAALGAEGMAWVAAACAPDRVDALLRAAISPRPAPAAPAATPPTPGRSPRTKAHRSR